MRELWSPVWLVAKRELRDQMRDWRILLPLIFLTLVFPFLMIAGTQTAVDTVNKYGGNLIADRMAPFFLMIVGFFPVTISLVVALESFVGEKERGTIEPLLSSPLKDWQIYMGKMLTSIIVPLTASYLDIGFYILLLSFQGITLPGFWLVVQMLLLTFVHAVLMVSASILISTQSTSVRSANLLASFIIIPVALLIQGETVMIFWGNNQILWLAIVAVLIMAGLIMRVGIAHFRRESLIGRELDAVNIRWIWQTFKKAFIGKAHSIWSWYGKEVPHTLNRLRIPLTLLLILAIAGIGAGFVSINAYSDEIQGIIEKARNNGNVQEDLRTALENQNFLPTDGISFQFIFLHNLQAVTLMAFFGFFSFSVLGTILFMVNMGIIGVVAGGAQFLGLPPGLLLLIGVMPHGIFELPAILLGAAVVFYIGALLVTPDGYRSLGEVIIESFAIWLKVMLGVVVPLLIIAAFIETNITPLLLANFLNM